MAMSVGEILSTAVARGVTFILEGAELSYRAPKGAMTQELRDAVTSRKGELISALQRARGTGEAPIPRSDASESEPAPLSPGQERLWLIDRLSGRSPLYNVHFRMEWSGPLDRVGLERGLRAVARRHASLRTTFREVDGEPRAVVAPDPAVPVVFHDLRDLVAEVRPRALDRLAREQRREPFDLERGPLWRVAVVTLDEGSHVLLVTQHHIITDGWSVGLFLGELGDELRGGARAVDRLRYADYARWQRGRFERPGFQESLRWWKERLEGLPRLELPYARARGAVDTHAGDAYRFSLSAETTARLKALARARHCTVYVVLLTAWATLLHRLSGASTFAVGTVTTGRDRDELRDVIGFFTNTLAVRCELAGDPTVAEAIEHVRAEVEAAFAREVPFGDVVGALGASLNPLIQACLVLENAPVPETRPDSGRYRVVIDKLNASVEGTAKFDLNLILREEGGSLEACLEYATALFAPETIERMIGHFRALVDDLARRPDARLSQLHLLSPAERHRVLVEPNAATLAVEERPFHEQFEARAAAQPNALALVAGGERLTYGELDARANRLARHLQKLGVGPDSLVAIWRTRRDAESIVSILGIAKAGGAYVPLDPKAPAARNRELIAGAGIQVLVTEAALAPEQEGMSARRVQLDALAELAERPMNKAGPANLAYVIFTSGSTGRPKGVGVEHRQLAHYLAGISTRLALPDGAAYAHVSSFAADLGHTSLFCPLTTGGAMHFLPEEATLDPDALAAWFEAHPVDCLKIVPSHLEALLSKRVLPRKLLVLAGEALRWELVARIQELAPELRIINSYGPTETSVGMMTCEASSGASATVPIGRPLPNTRAYVLDAALQPVPLGARGELYIGGAQVSRGYVGRPDLTADRFLPDPFDAAPGARMYRTGDLVRRLDSGEVEFLARADHQLKIRGFRVEPGEIEAALSTYPAVRGCIVVPHTADRLAAYAVAPPGTEDALRAHLKARLPDSMVPSFLVILDALPLGPNGKIDRARLPPPAPTPSAAQGRAPATPTERVVARAWHDVLGVAPADVQQTFAELGGHSLLTLRLRARLQELLPEAPPLSAMLAHPTVESLARAIDARAPEAAKAIRSGPRLVELRAGDAAHPPLFLIHPAGGVESGYFTLATRFDPSQPLYAVRADFSGLDASVERLAARYIDLLRTRAPEGPYFVGGASFGGLVAYEMAQQLRHQREPVGPVFLIDTEEPGDSTRAPRTDEEILAFLRAMVPELVDLLLLPPAARPPAERDLFPEAAAFLRDFRDCLAARAAYEARPYAGDVVFLRAADRGASLSAHPEDGWRPLVKGRFTVIDVPGNHMTMLQGPNAEIVARHLNVTKQERA